MPVYVFARDSAGANYRLDAFMTHDRFLVGFTAGLLFAMVVMLFTALIFFPLFGITCTVQL